MLSTGGCSPPGPLLVLLLPSALIFGNIDLGDDTTFAKNGIAECAFWTRTQLQNKQLLE